MTDESSIAPMNLYRTIKGLKMGDEAMIIYEGSLRGEYKPLVVRYERNELGRVSMEVFDPAPSQEIYNHSPDGFSWGYRGSGPAQLALALLLDATGNKDLALGYHQEFKEDFIAGFGETWQLDAGQIQRWVGLKLNYTSIKGE